MSNPFHILPPTSFFASMKRFLFPSFGAKRHKIGDHTLVAPPLKTRLTCRNIHIKSICLDVYMKNMHHEPYYMYYTHAKVIRNMKTSIFLNINRT